MVRLKDLIRPVCNHGKFQREQCDICSPGNFCRHGKVLSRCYDCYGIGWCRHYTNRMLCSHCKNFVCPHQRNIKKRHD